MKTTLTILSLLSATFTVHAAEPAPPACQLINPEKLIVNEDGSRELAATSVQFHGEWTLKDGVICGVHGHEKHIATLKFAQPFEDCVLTFRVRFVDAGSFVFVAGAHGMDVAFSASSPATPAQRTSLYDLKTDPMEKNDLASSNPEKLAELTARWKKWDSENARPMWKAVSEGAKKPTGAENRKKRKAAVQKALEE